MGAVEIPVSRKVNISFIIYVEYINQLSAALEEIFMDVKDAIENEYESALKQLRGMLLSLGQDVSNKKSTDWFKRDGIKTAIECLGSKLKVFIGWKSSGGKWELTGGGIGRPATGYSSAYRDTEWDNTVKAELCAKIFLGCIPLIFSALSYLYWQCNKSKWPYQAIDDSNEELGIYMMSLGYKKGELNVGYSGRRIANLLGNQFMELNISLALKGGYPSYIKYVFEQSRGDAARYSGLSASPLASIYIVTRSYFQSKQGKHANHPTTVRQMLYWLMGLPYTPVYKYIDTNGLKTFFKDGISKPEINFIRGKNDNITFKVKTAHYYVIPSCFYSGFVLMAIEGKLHGKSPTSYKNKSLLHDIYSNNHFKFYYPDNVSEWFGTLWDIVSCLYYQLFFLNEQCGTCVYLGCGWRWCKYGGNVAQNVTSWICNNNKQQQGTNHVNGCTTGGCSSNHEECGKKNNPSPLQAFLSDGLAQFMCPKIEKNEYPPYTEHSSHIVHTSQRCPIPMGFNGLLSSVEPARTGTHLHSLLCYIVDDSRSHVSLYNIILCMIRFALRTPRNLGELFAFYINIGDKENFDYVDTALRNEINGYPGYHYGTNLVSSIQDLCGTEAKHGHNGKASLRSIHDSVCPGQMCGQYLGPIAWSIYNVLPEEFAGLYLSVIVYLTGELLDGLNALLDAFKNINCTHCVHMCNCKPGEHASKCSCKTIVQCAEVLPLFYKYGFLYNNAEALNGFNIKTGVRDDKNVRSCYSFATQLMAVKDGLFDRLIAAIAEFLENIRLPFFLYLMTFCLLSITYLTYGLTIPLDILQIRSHWRFALTHKVLPTVTFTEKTVTPRDILYLKP
ncbi:uncharacterized protein BXIN_0465 [Babesia sp. Xinjiang]|uniref:uncharacterized protein n=1 Tax=Babesia sp. Xinjiang TaxID=462227 RepID=UPI000A258500|nr:uncharacterized protein BXIN_0465 [Babesia sp. Xinjiang]ORM41907.1 hypothetical protein BXIN_0465 [Babesia sp. Xinjiang]